MRGKQALSVGETQQEPESGEVRAQRVRAVVRYAHEPSQGRGEDSAVGLQPAAEELQQLGKLDGIADVEREGGRASVGLPPGLAAG